MAFAPKASQTLMTPEPHYIPGYSGHCPHYRFTLGRTYGKVTSQILVCSQANCPGRRLLLQPNSSRQDGEGCPEGEGEQEQEQEQEGDRCSRGKPSPPLGHQAIPGYTGFIPRAQNYFAKTYSEICRDSWSEFSRQLARDAGRKQRRVAPRGASPREPKLLTAKHKMPLAAVPPRGSHGAFKPQGSPHSPQKDFMSGFTGFVPRAQYLIGASYPVITRRALLEFERMRCKAEQGAPERGAAEALVSVAKTYPMDTGLLPHYKGYVPGYKFRFGRTFGRLTHNALGRGPAEKQTAELPPSV